MVKHGLEGDFRRNSTVRVAVVLAVALIPFAINNFIQGRVLVALGQSVIVALLTFSAWSIRRGRYYSSLASYLLVPSLLAVLMLALTRHALVATLWCYPVVVAFYLLLPERRAWLANTLLLAIALPMAWYFVNPALAIRLAATLLLVSAFAAIFVRVIAEQQKKLEALAVTDTLTGVFNRTLLQSTLETAIRRFARSDTPMALIALDMDHFKSINDSLGHAAGDAVLAGVGDLLRKRVRGSDRVFRLGGEEFLLYLYGTGTDGAVQLAEALRAEIESSRFVDDWRVTASFGVAALCPDEEWSAWMKRSDDNLYRAKAGGRNRVVG